LRGEEVGRRVRPRLHEASRHRTSSSNATHASWARSKARTKSAAPPYHGSGISSPSTQSRTSRTFARAASSGARSSNRRSFTWSTASTRSKRSKSADSKRHTRWDSTSSARRRASWTVRRSGGSPRCSLLVPALSTTMRSPSPASSTSRRMIASAAGERQMLPQHTKQIRNGDAGGVTSRATFGHDGRLLVEQRQDLVGGRGRQREHALGDADRFEVVELAVVGDRPERDDLELVGVASP